MEKNEIKKGMIVVIENGVTFGNKPGTITKVLSRPNRFTDQTAEHVGSFYQKAYPGTFVLCDVDAEEDIFQLLKEQSTCNNKPCYLERVDDLRPATDEEKRLYIKNKRKPINNVNLCLKEQTCLN